MPTRPIVMRSVPVTLRLPEDLHSYLEKRAEAEERSLPNLITQLLREARKAEGAEGSA
ncbi:Arc family DNA-binding protein [Limibacillus halophilus]